MKIWTKEGMGEYRIENEASAGLEHIVIGSMDGLNPWNSVPENKEINPGGSGCRACVV